jgi:hypothetical protein
MGDSLTEVVGVIHIHSTHSDGTGSIEEILEAGTGLDFLILTDHHTLQAKTMGWEGWHKNTLLLIGEEVSSQDGDCLCLGTKKETPPQDTGENTLQAVRDQGGLSILAHPHGAYCPLIRKIDHSWKNWETPLFDGIELWSYMFDWASSFKYHKWWKHYYFPDSQIQGPPRETLKKWDEICQKRRCFAIGGLDAHAKKLLNFTVLPYKHCFESLRTHVLIPRGLTDSAQDGGRVLQGLAEGKSFIGFDGLSCSRGTQFQSADGELQMGDETSYNRPTLLVGKTPRAALLKILRNGQTVAEGLTQTLDFKVNEPGVYRLEASLGGKPWIYTNPIYFRCPP